MSPRIAVVGRREFVQLTGLGAGALILGLRPAGAQAAAADAKAFREGVGRLLAAVPITPGGVGFVELGYIGGLTAAGGSEAQVVAAVLLFRVLTYGVQIPLGGFTYVIWRLKKSWRREAPKVELEPEPERQAV